MTGTYCPGRAINDWVDAVPPHQDDAETYIDQDLLEELVNQDEALVDAFITDARDSARRLPGRVIA